jgi:hypothetical protein
MSLFNLKTGKPIEMPESQVVSDLDAMVAMPVAFRLHGKVHYIKPISVREFYAFTNAMISLQGLEKAEHVTPQQIIELYFNLIRSVCDSVARPDVEKMTQAQCGALLNLIVECVTGKAQVEKEAGAEEKKNPLAPPSFKYQQPSMWQRLVSTLPGLQSKS